MPFTALLSKSNGSSSISKAELQDLFDNIAWLRTPPSFRLHALPGNGETINSSLLSLDLNTGFGDGGVYEWTQRGGGDQPDNTYYITSGGNHVNVGDVEPGVWLAGAMVAYETDPDSLASATSEYWRRAQMQRGDGSTWTEMADVTVQAGVGLDTPRRCSLHIAGMGAFDATNDRIRLQGQGGMTVAVLESPQPDRRWGLWIGQNTNYTSDYAAARPTSTTQAVTWWNQMRTNQLRLQWRPTAQRYKSGSNQAVTANTATVVTFASSDWATDSGLTGTANVFTIQQTGWYLVGGQVTAAAMRSATSFVTVAIRKNAITTRVIANAAEISASTGSTVAQCYGMVFCEAGDELDMVVVSGININVEASRGTQMWCALVSSASGVSTGRQVFHQMPAPANIPSIADISGSYLPLGLMRIASDLTDRLWHRPLVNLRLTDEQEVEQGQWTNIDCGVLLTDYTGLDAAGFAPATNGGFKVPWPGSWLVCARLSFSTLPAEGGAAIGSQGHRGMRLALNGKRAAGQILASAMNVSSHGWTKNVCELFVVNQADAEINLQGFISGLNNAEKSGVVTDADIWVVEVGDGTTWYPLGEP